MRLPWRKAQERQPNGYRPGPFALIYTALLIVGLAASAVVYEVLVHGVPGMAANRADTVKTALLVIGGSGALAGLYVAYRKQRTDEANHLRDQDKLFTERYTQAAAQLGSPAAAVRLAGVYALARIADDSERDRPTCLKVLCAYLRMPYDPDATERAEREVRTTAQTVVAERLRTHHPGFWEGAEIDLRGAHLIDVSFESVTVAAVWADKATFYGTAEFEGATINGDARFGRATFEGDARFGGVTCSGSIWFDGAAFNGGAWFARVSFNREAWFGGATFTMPAWFGGAAFNEGVEFNETTFNGSARFDEAAFNRKASFDKATFNQSARFNQAAFTGDARFVGVTFNGDAEFTEATFHELHPPRWPDGFAEPEGISWLAP